MTVQPRLRVVKDKKEGSGDKDLFGGENAGYSVDNFYVSSKDGAGNSETKYLKLSGSMIGRIGSLISMRAIPQYRTDADFIRDAIVHRLHAIGTMLEDGTILDTVNRAVKLNRMHERQLELAEFNAIIQTHEETMVACLASEDVALLEDLISDAESDWEDLRPNYQVRLTTVIDKYKGELKKLKERNKQA